MSSTPGTEKLYWKLVSFKPVSNYWSLQFEMDVSNGRKSQMSFDSNIYETKRLTIFGGRVNSVDNAIELRYVSQVYGNSRGYGNNIYYEMDASNLVTVYVYALNSANSCQICRLTSVINLNGISNITWHTPVNDAGTQPTNPIKFKEAFPAIASTLSDIGSDSVPVYVNKGKPVVCNSSNLKAGKDDDGNVIKNTYQKKLTFDTTPTAGSTNPVTSEGIKTALEVLQSNIDTVDVSYASKKLTKTINGTTTDVVAASTIISDTNTFGNFAAVTDVNVDGTIYQTYWKIAPTSSNIVYGFAAHPTIGVLFRIQNKKGRYYATRYDNNTTYIFDGTYNSSTNKAATVSSVTTRIATAKEELTAAIDTVDAKGIVINEIDGENVICFE